MFERKEPLISIIVPSWFNSEQHGKYGRHETFWFAAECLKRLLAVTPREKFELIIIDNGSTIMQSDIVETDLIIGMGVEEYWLNADVLIRNKENLGFGPAVNQGVNLARGKYIVCLNNDIIVYSGWENALLNVFEQQLDPLVGVVMPALLIGERDAQKALELKNPDFSKHAGQYGQGAEFGSCFMIKKELVDRVKQLNREEIRQSTFFDESFLLGMSEDRKVWQQVRMLGFQTYRCHDTRVFHIGNNTIGKVSDRKEYTTKNRELLLEWKNKHGLL